MPVLHLGKCYDILGLAGGVLKHIDCSIMHCQDIEDARSFASDLTSPYSQKLDFLKQLQTIFLKVL
jgi:hypothetical protein